MKHTTIYPPENNHGMQASKSSFLLNTQNMANHAISATLRTALGDQSCLNKDNRSDLFEVFRAARRKYGLAVKQV